MQLSGEWYECDDGVARPTIRIDVCCLDARLPGVQFVIDTAADQTVLSAHLAPHLPALGPQPAGLSLSGVGGEARFRVANATLEFTRPGQTPVTIRGEFAVFADLEALDMPVLGRDVTDLFDLIISRRHNTVLLLGGNHRFAVQGP